MKNLVLGLFLLVAAPVFGASVSIESNVTADANSPAAKLVDWLAQSAKDVDKVTLGNETRYTLKGDDVSIQCSEFSPGPGTNIQIQTYSCKFSAN